MRNTGGVIERSGMLRNNSGIRLIGHSEAADPKITTNQNIGLGHVDALTRVYKNKNAKPVEMGGSAAKATLASMAHLHTAANSSAKEGLSTALSRNNSN